MDKNKGIKDLKRANQARKLYLANKAGFNNVEDYKVFLLEPSKDFIILTIEQVKKFKSANKDRKKVLAERWGTTVEKIVKSYYKKQNASCLKDSNNIESIHNIIILDNSASMAGAKFNNAYKGVKDEIAELKKDKTINYTQSFMCFTPRSYTWSSVPNLTHFNITLEKFRVPSINTDNSTPLYDCICLIKDTLRDSVKKTDNVLLKIFTDGRDMGSANSATDARAAIENLKDLGVTVTFVGTKEDVSLIENRLKVDKSNTLVHDNTGKGVKEAFEKTLTATKTYSSKVSKGEDVSTGFYKELL